VGKIKNHQNSWSLNLESNPGPCEYKVGVPSILPQCANFYDKEYLLSSKFQISKMRCENTICIVLTSILIEQSYVKWIRLRSDQLQYGMSVLVALNHLVLCYKS
jgi:hypothetical protein